MSPLITGVVNVGDSIAVNIGNYNFAGGTTYNLNAYTINPNGIPDTMTANDTSAYNNIFAIQSPVVNLGSDTILNVIQTITLDAGSGFNS